MAAITTINLCRFRLIWFEFKLIKKLIKKIVFGFDIFVLVVSAYYILMCILID